jgi:O-antigen ligase
MTKQNAYLHYTGAAGAALLPFALLWLSPVYGLIVTAIGVLLAGNKHIRIKPLLLFAAFIDWQLLSVFWSDYKPEAWADVVMVLPIAVMGILMHAVYLNNANQWVLRWLETFAWAVILAWTIVFCKSLYLHGWVNYKGFELGGRLGVHFQSLYLFLAALILERKIWRNTYGLSALRAFAVVWLLFGIIVLSSRIHLLLVPIAVVARFIEIGIKNKTQRKKITSIAIASLTAGALLITVLPGPRGRMIDLRNEVRSIQGKVDGKQTNHRVFIWQAGAEIIADQPWIGLGNGSGEMALHEKLRTVDATFYRGKEPYKLDEFMYDFHCIWIQSWAEGGLVGLMLLLGIFIWGIVSSHGVLRYAWVMVLLSGTTESLIDKQAGALLLTFLVGLTALQSQKEKREPIS